MPAGKPQAQEVLTLDGTSGSNFIFTDFTISEATSLQLGFFVDYLIVGGGGGGGGTWNGGGGGAGGLLTNVGGTPLQLTAANHAVAVGAGGLGHNPNVTNGGNGGDSSFGGLTAIGGGRGATEIGPLAANSGGSGGGGSHSGGNVTAGGSGTAGQGNQGGNAVNGTLVGGGGGGAGAAAANVTASGGPTNGGAGLANTITGSSLPYAGGGGGGRRTGTAAAGGTGGGGAGGSNSNGIGGTPNTGGGGGGGGGGSDRAGGNGGSGVVIIRYAGEALPAVGPEPTSFIGDGANGDAGVTYQVHSFTESGAFDLQGVNLDARLGATLFGSLSGDGQLTFNGPGRLTLAGFNTLTGPTTVAQGTLAVSGSLADSALTVAGGATLAGSGTVGSTTVANGGLLAPGAENGFGQLSLDSLSFGADQSDTATVAIPLEGFGTTPSASLWVSGDVTTSGGPGSVAFAFGPSLALVPTGTYQLLGYGGGLVGDAADFIATGTVGGRQTVNLTATSGALNLEVENSIVNWAGDVDGGWSTADNWRLSSTGGATSFQADDVVVFGDTATTGGVSLTENVAPSLVFFQADSLDYTLSTANDAGITAGSLTKAGAATLTIATDNSFAGGTTLSAGRLRAGSDTALGTGPITFSGGTLLAADTSPRLLANDAVITSDTTLGDATDSGSLTLSGAVDLGGGSRTLTTLSDVAFSGAIANGSLVKAGGGSLTLSGPNTFDGGTTLSAGSLLVGTSTALGAGGLTFSAAGTTLGATADLSLANEMVLSAAAAIDTATHALVLAGPLSGPGGLTTTGTGTGILTLTAANSYTGGTTIAAGTLDIGGGGTTGSVTGNIANSGTLVFNRADNLSYAGAISGSGSLVKEAAGTLTLSGTNSFTGAVTVASGTLEGTALAAFGGGTTGRTVSVNDGGTIEFARSGMYGGHATSAIPEIVINSGGTVRNTVGNNPLNNVTLNGGTLTASASTNSTWRSWNINGTITSTGNSLIEGGAAADPGIMLQSATNSNTNINVVDGNLTISAPIVNGMVSSSSAYSSTLTKLGDGTLTLSAANAYSGGTAVNAGTLAATAASAVGTGVTSVAPAARLEIGHATALQGSTLSPASGATVAFTAAGTSYTIGGLAGGGTIDATGLALSVGGNNASTTFAGTLTADSLTKQGSGTLTVSGTNTLGSLTVSGGTLLAMSPASLVTGSVTLAGGRLQHAGSDPISTGIVLSGAAGSNTIDAVHALDYLVVGGGGGGAGRDISGGGGAGGVLSNLTAGTTPFTVSGGSVSVAVGAGGNGGANAANGANGQPSSLGSITALGGGGGGRWDGTPNSGASGGGGGGFGTTGGAAGTAGQGFAGGAANGIGGGGGGAGGPGQNGRPDNLNKAGDGGVGLVVPIMSGDLATTLAIGEVSDGAVYFGGGGGGSPHRDNTSGLPGLGGLGGGGNAPSSSSVGPQAGAANTGGGGAASRSNNSARWTGGRGGSGVVVVRYEGAPRGTGGTVTQGTGADAGYTFHTFKSTVSSSLVLDAAARTISGDITGTGGFTFNSPGAVLTLSGNNSYEGGTIVSGGTLAAGSTTALGTGRLTTAAGGSVSFTAPGTNTYEIPSIAGGGTLSAGGNALVVGSDNSSTSYTGSIAAASLTKQGSGALALAGSNTLGSTTLSSGTLAVRANDALGAGPLTISAGRLRASPATVLTNAITLSGEAASISLDALAPVVEYLVVGGGGGGDNTVSGVVYGAGGGGGGVLQGSVDDLAAGSYSITVGAGGTAPGGRTSTAGQASAAFGIEAAGGLAGSTGLNGRGGASGSGFAGGTRSGFSAGGGGGAGGTGGNGGPGRRGGDGGVGVSSSITGSAEMYGGGGGGNEFTTNPPGAGGAGGGGAGGQPGVANTGGGGGGDRAGGSGIVIVRYQGEAIATGGTISQGTGSAEGYTLHTFTDVGSATLAFTNITSTLAGDISGPGGFTWDSVSTLVLSGDNSYEGGTILSAGTLTAGSHTAFGSGTITLGNGTSLDLGGFAIGNTIINNGGTILNAGDYSGTLDVEGEAIFDGGVGGTVAIAPGGRGRFRGAIGGRIEIAAGGIAELDDSASVGGAAEFINNGILRADRATNMTIGRPISGSGALEKRGVGRLVLSGNHTYTGGTDVEAGTLVVNGSILGDVSLAAGSRLGGTGSIAGTVGGAGIFGPGASPGITTVGSIDPTGGLGFEFEITGPLPAWADAAASVNDVIRITSGTPFTSALSAANTISILLDVPGLDPAAPGTYTAGFFTDTASDFTSFIENASFDYWVAGEFGTADDRQQFATGGGGALEWYTRMSAYDPALSVQWQVVPTTADFGSGDVNGYSTQFVVVPEPASLALAGLGLAGLTALLRCRRA